MNIIEYSGYIAHIEFDDKERIFVGNVADIQEIISFKGTSVNKLENAFHESIDNYLAISKKTRQKSQKTFSGKLLLRISPDIHAAIASTSKVEGKSINQWISDTVAKAVNI